MGNQPSKGKESPTVPRTASNHVEQDDSGSSAPVSEPRGRYQPDSKFMDLPIEITFNVFDYLETPRDSLALSLACKGLFAALFAEARVRFNSADRWGKEPVLMMLEESAPPHCVYCPFCKVIHTVDKVYRRTSCLESQNLATSSFYKQLVGVGTRRLDLLDARFHMNAVRFNRPGADELLEPLRGKCEARLGRSQWIHEFEAKTKRPGLLSQGKAWGDGIADVWLETTSRHIRTGHQPFEKFTYSVCKHVHIHAEYPYIYADYFYLYAKDPYLYAGYSCLYANRYQYPRYWVRDGPSIHSACVVCKADWRITMEWIPQLPSLAEGWVLKISSIHHLSYIRYDSDFTREWARCAGAYETPDVKEMMKRREGRWEEIYQDTWNRNCPM